MIDISVLFSNRHVHDSINRIWIWAKIWANYKTRPLIIGSLFNAYLLFFFQQQKSQHISLSRLCCCCSCWLCFYTEDTRTKKSETHPLSFYVITSYTFPVHLSTFYFLFSEWICHLRSNLPHHQWNTHQWGTMMSLWQILKCECIKHLRIHKPWATNMLTGRFLLKGLIQKSKLFHQLYFIKTLML